MSSSTRDRRLQHNEIEQWLTNKFSTRDIEKRMKAMSLWVYRK